MAKTNAEYFSHDTDASQDEKVIYLESLFGDSGYAWFFKMLETLGRSTDFEIEWNELKCAVLARKFNATQQEFNNFIVAATLPEIRAFVIENGKLHSPGLKKRLEKMVDRRRKEATRLAEKRKKHGVAPTHNGVAATLIQSKVKESKVKDINVVDACADEKKMPPENSEAEDQKKIPSPVPAAPSPKTTVETWLDEMWDDTSVKECFTRARKVPADRYDEYFQAFRLEALTKPETYNKRSDLTNHFLNYSGRKYEEFQRSANRPVGPSAPNAPSGRATIRRYDNDREELKKEQKF